MQCPECGFDNAEGANYCQKCGAYLGATGEIKAGETTEAYTVDDTTGALKPVDLDRVTSQGASLVADILLLGGQLIDELFELLVAERAEIRKRVHTCEVLCRSERAASIDPRRAQAQ